MGNRRAFVQPGVSATLALIGVAGLASAAFAQAPAGGAAGGGEAPGAASAVTPVLAITMAPANGSATLTVTSAAFHNGQAMPERYTQFGAGESPPLHWSRGPSGTQSYVVLAEDSGVHRPQPIFHWVLFNVPANVTTLPANLPKTAQLAKPAGAMNGLNMRKQAGYMGPKPPKGQTHAYHFEIFALDEKLPLTADMADRNAVVDAMKGHVLAEGEIVANVTGK